MRRDHLTNQRSGRGFSILELLIALIIIGILAVILIPIVANRTSQARLRAAESDLERIANAEDMVAIDTGYYVRMFMLNDTVGRGTDDAFTRTPALVDSILTDTVQQYNGTGYYQNLNRLFIYSTHPRTGQLVSAATGSDLRTRLLDNETEFNWNGSYVNFQVDKNFYDGDSESLPDGLADDPWGNNYHLFVPRALDISGSSQNGGVVVEPDGTIEQVANLVLGGRFAATTEAGVTVIVSNVDCEVFDRPTLVSLGPNGIPGDQIGDRVGSGDDIIRQFGP